MTRFMTPMREHFLRTFPVGTHPFDDHSCTPVRTGSENARHFQIKTLGSQRWRSGMYSSVRWPESDEFLGFSWFSWKTENSQKRLSYCGFRNGKTRIKHGFVNKPGSGLKQGEINTGLVIKKREINTDFSKTTDFIKLTVFLKTAPKPGSKWQFCQIRKRTPFMTPLMTLFMTPFMTPLFDTCSTPLSQFPYALYTALTRPNPEMVRNGPKWSEKSWNSRQ